MRNYCVNNFKFGPAVQMLFKDFSIFSSGGHFVQWSQTVRAIFVEGTMVKTYVCFDSLLPSQQFFSHVGKGLPGLKQY